jgi:hypothetical protein
MGFEVLTAVNMNSSLLGCDAVQSGRSVMVFRETYCFYLQVKKKNSKFKNMKIIVLYGSVYSGR